MKGAVRSSLAKWRERRELERPSGSFVYFIECAEASAIKVGFTRDVERRMSTIQSSSPFELTLIGVVPGGIEHEARLHFLFRNERIRGEWFRDGGHLRTMIDALMRLPEAQRTEIVEREPSVPADICRPEAEAEAREDIKRLVEVVAEEHGVLAACELYLRAWLR